MARWFDPNPQINPDCFRHEDAYSAYASDRIKVIEHFTHCERDPAFKAYCDGRVWLDQKGRSKFPLFYLMNGRIMARMTGAQVSAACRRFDPAEHDDYLTCAADSLKAAYGAGSLHEHQQWCKAVADLVAARMDFLALLGRAEAA